MTFAYPIIAAQTAAILAILQAVLMFRTGNYRRAHGISLGDGGNDALLRRIRAHGNLAENAAIVLLLLALVEGTGAAGAAVCGFAIFFTVARFSHAFAISVEKSPIIFRVIGAAGTVLTLIGLSVTLLITLGVPFMS